MQPCDGNGHAPGANRSAGCVDVDAVSGVVYGRDADEVDDGSRLRHVDSAVDAAFNAHLLHLRGDADALQRRVGASAPPDSRVEYVNVLQHRFGYLAIRNMNYSPVLSVIPSG